MSGAHAPLMPSAAPRWGVCALSVRLEAQYPHDDSPQTLDGTAAHWVVERLIKDGQLPPEDTAAPNGVAVTREMLEGAQLVAETLAAELGPDWRRFVVVEERISIPRIHPTHCWGTPDIYALSGDGRLWLFDYKSGYRVVEPRGNQQLVAYAAGLIPADRDDRAVRVSMAVIQPRAPHRLGPVRKWECVASELRPHINVLRNQAELALSPNPPAQPDVEACRDCKGRHACEALQRSAFSAAQTAEVSGALDMTPLALGRELRTLKRAQALLDARVSGLEAQIEALQRGGVSVPFWTIEREPGRKTWIVPTAEVLALGDIYGVKLAGPVKPLTPNQAMKAGLPETLVNMYSSRSPGAAKLVPDDGTTARLTFSSSDT